MPPPISEHAHKCAAKMFPADELPEVIRLLEEGSGADSERLQCAVLRISKGVIPKLIHAIKETKIDSRDVLMAADFGLDVDAHKTWHGEP